VPRPPVVKQCARCQQFAPVNEFGRDTKSRDGFGYHCRTCRRLLERQRYAHTSAMRQNNPSAVAEWRCSRCSVVKPSSEFYRRTASRIGIQSFCKVCARARRRHTYVTNPARVFVFEYLCVHPCVDCGETDPVVLEFDHVRGPKLFNFVDVLRAGAYTLSQVEAEIAKCEVRCASCHRRKTAAERGWWADLIAAHRDRLASK
jgi:hypothetical protein